MEKQQRLASAVFLLVASGKTLRSQPPSFAQAADVIGTKLAVVAIVKLCYLTKSWPSLNEHLVLLCKRRAQLKQAIVAMVRESLSYVDQTPTLEVKTELIKTMTTLATGKIFLEAGAAFHSLERSLTFRPLSTL